MTDYADYQTPGAHATAIAKAGVPLLSNPANLVTELGVSIPAADNQEYTSLTLSQTGYDGAILVSFPVAATVPFVEVQLIWVDSASTLTVATETRIVAGSAGITPLQTMMSGIAKADQLTVNLVNLDPAQAATVSIVLNQDSVTRAGDRWYWRNAVNSGLTVPTYTLPDLPADESVLGVLQSVNVPASSNTSFLLGMGNAVPVTLTGAFSGVTAASCQLVIQCAPTAFYSTSAELLNAVQASTSVDYTFTPPRCPLILQIANLATSGTLNFRGLMVEQA